MRTVMAAALAWAALSGAAAAQDSQRELELAREIVILSGASENMAAMMDTMGPILTQEAVSRGLSQSDAQRLTELSIAEFRADTDRLIELVAIGYADAFTQSELEGIHAFFQSPAGQAMRRETPRLTAALARAGAIIGEEVGMRAAARLQEEHQGVRGPS